MLIADFDERKNIFMYLYPPDITEITVKRWKQINSRIHSSPPFPTNDELKTILDVIYHVSFLTEENRRIAVRIAYFPQKDFENQLPPYMNTHDIPIPFSQPIRFNVSEVLRLAPALEPTVSAIAICSTKDIESSLDDSPLAIWGIFNQGDEWWKLLTGRKTAAFVPPNVLTISTFAPGYISASTMGSVLFRLRAGELLNLPLEDLNEGHIGDFLNEAAEDLYGQTCQVLGIKRYDSDIDSDNHPRHQYFRTLTNIVNLTREKGHGGSFIIFSNDISANDERLEDRVTIKYPLNSPNIWNELISEAEANWHYYKLLFPKKSKKLNSRTGSADASVKDLKSMLSWENKKNNAQQKIAEFEQFVSSLSGVDGAVVLTDHLKVLGFGAEITATSPSLKVVRIADTPDAKKYSEKQIDSYGTRHRSALRLCSNFEHLICIVISQDGSIRAIKRIGSKVYMWNDVSLSNQCL